MERLGGGLAPGTVFAGHRIEEIAGRGGMGVVYRATHIALDHVVALKVISPDLVGDEHFRQRFQSEFRIAVSIRHPNVVSVHHAGEEEGLLFVTMDFIEGTDLRGLVTREGWLDPSAAGAILGQVAAALDAAHSKGLIHRDIKPGNVLIEHRPGGDHAYLTDFGLARAIDSQTGLTASGAFIGTIDYAAPEQIQGDRLDARTDIYALGCLLYEMLSGSTPFAKQTEKVAKMYAHLQEPPPDLRELRPELPADLAGAVTRAMAKDPDERFQSAGDLGRAARAAIEGRLVSDEERTVATGLAAPAAAGTAAAQTAASPGPVPAVQEPTAPHQPSAEETAAAPRPVEATAPHSPSTKTARTRAIDEPPPDEPGTVPVTTPPAPESGPTEPLPRRDATARRRRLAALGIVAAVAAAAVVAVIALSGGGDETAPVADAGAGDGGGGDQQGLGDAEVLPGQIPVAGFPVGIAVGFDTVWIGSRFGGTLTEIDPKTKDTIATIDALAAPEGVTVGPASVYVAESDASIVLRIDPESGSQTEIPTGGQPRAIAHGGPGIYVTNADSNTVTPVEIGPDTAEPLAEIHVGQEPHGIAIGEGSVWVTNRTDGTVTRIDEKTDEVLGTITVGANPKGVAVESGTVWVANTDDDTVTPIDAGSGMPGEAISVADEPRGVTAGFGSVWVANGGGAVTRIDPQTRETQEMPVGASPEEVAAGEKFVYVTDGEGDAVYRIRP